MTQKLWELQGYWRIRTAVFNLCHVCLNLNNGFLIQKSVLIGLLKVIGKKEVFAIVLHRKRRNT